MIVSQVIEEILFLLLFAAGKRGKLRILPPHPLGHEKKRNVYRVLNSIHHALYIPMQGTEERLLLPAIVTEHKTLQVVSYEVVSALDKLSLLIYAYFNTSVY